MDFRRIEWIFLVIFVAIDIFLFVSFRQSGTVQTSGSAQTGDSNGTIIKEMKSDQIKFSQPSAKSSDGYYISSSNNNDLEDKAGSLLGQSTSYSDDQLTSTFETPVAISNSTAEKATDIMMKDSSQVSHGKEYHYSKQLSTKNQIIYVQDVTNGSIYSQMGEVRFKVSNNEITGYTQGYLSDVQSLREKTDTISEQRALIWLYQYNEIPNGAQIQWTKLGYTKLLSIQESSVYVPTWIIAMKTNNTTGTYLRRVNAFTGAILKSETSAKSVTTD